MDYVKENLIKSMAQNQKKNNFSIYNNGKLVKAIKLIPPPIQMDSRSLNRFRAKQLDLELEKIVINEKTVIK